MDTKSVNNNSMMPTLQPTKSEQANASERTKKVQQAAVDSSSSSVAQGKGDFDVSLSPKAREMMEARKKALDIARNTPDVREDKVAEMKARINSGAYKPDANKIYDGMMREAILDHLASNPEE